MPNIGAGSKRATPHATTGMTPAELLLGRALKTRVPEIIPSKPNRKVQIRDRKQKEKMKYYADLRRNAKDRKLKIGDDVLVKQPKQNKLSTPYSPEPYQVIKQKGSMITVKNDDEKEITRNSSFFKKLKLMIPIQLTPQITRCQRNPSPLSRSRDARIAIADHQRI